MGISEAAKLPHNLGCGPLLPSMQTWQMKVERLESLVAQKM